MNLPDFYIDNDGRLVMSFGLYHEQFVEPLCCECGQPVRWVLDMFSFKSSGRGDFLLGHAECLWTSDGFDKARARAKLLD